MHSVLLHSIMYVFYILYLQLEIYFYMDTVEYIVWRRLTFVFKTLISVGTFNDICYEARCGST